MIREKERYNDSKRNKRNTGEEERNQIPEVVFVGRFGKLFI